MRLLELSHLRGHPIYLDPFDGTWRYLDNDESTVTGHVHRPCGLCGLPNTRDGHDGCIGTLPHVQNACCGHGTVSEAYVQFPSGVTIRGERAIDIMSRLRKDTSHGGGAGEGRKADGDKDNA